MKRRARLTKERALQNTGEGWEQLCFADKGLGSNVRVLIGDAEEALRSIPDKVVNTCLTSPPYWRNRDYGDFRQIGREREAEDYVDALVSVFRELRRVLRDDGTVWLNLGDTYLSGVGTEKGRAPSRGWKRNKQQGLIPFRVALALEDEGWWVRNTVVWQKKNAMPESVDDRLTNVWEPVFLLAKSEYYYFNLNAVRVPHTTDDSIERTRAEKGGFSTKTNGNKELRKFLTSPRHRASLDGIREIRRRPDAPESTELAAFLRCALSKKGRDIHWVARQLQEPFERVRHYFRTDAIGSRLPPEATWLRLKQILDLPTDYDEAMNVVVDDNVFRNHPLGRNPGDVVQFATARGDFDHFATMPDRLAHWCLSATLPLGGICLDPFMGTGTTGIAALNLGGRFIGIDIDKQSLRAFGERLEERRAANTADDQRPIKTNGWGSISPVGDVSVQTGAVYPPDPGA